VADLMTASGKVQAIGRHGVSGKKTSVLARAAFEITTNVILQAALTGEVDHLGGVAENIIVGQPVNLGTGAIDVVYKAPAPVKETGKKKVPKKSIKDILAHMEQRAEEARLAAEAEAAEKAAALAEATALAKAEEEALLKGESEEKEEDSQEPETSSGEEAPKTDEKSGKKD